MNTLNEKVSIFFIEPHYVCYWNQETGHFKMISNSSFQKGKEMKLMINSNGYLNTKTNNKPFVVHQFLGEKLFGSKKKGYVVNHLDGNKTNNSKNNLEYVTIAENIAHAIKTGLHVANYPERNGRYIDGRSTKENLKQYKYTWLKNKNDEKRKNNQG
jgi:hypothetical protein